MDEFKPEAVYLFGSHIEGTARPESSYDVLVVSENVASIRLLERIKRAISATEDILLNITPLVYTPDEVDLLEKQGEGFMASVLENSKVLYKKGQKRTKATKGG